MTESSKELLYSIREWSPLTVVDAIPARVQRGLLPVDLNLTAVDAIPQFFALGSDSGIVFWYNRNDGEVQKLKSEASSRITCVKIVDSVEYMVAAGHANGQVSVFQIHKETPEDLNLVAPCTRVKPIQRYTIRDLHRSMVSCCEWSKNGMRLFSGDRQGVVVQTEFDYQAHLSKSKEILSEAYEIVQLSVYQCYLLVSTLYRSILCKRNLQTNVWHITQVGKKDRKQLVDCGGTFLNKSENKSPLLICGRPGLRFWIADVEGTVDRTLLFREAVQKSPTWEIPILNPKIPTNRNPASTTTNAATAPIASEAPTVTTNNFRELFLYVGQDSLIVTHDEVAMYILNLDKLKVEAVARGFRKILDFCVCDKEIFILEGERSLLRLAPLPEKPNKTAKIIFNPLLPPPVPILGSTVSSLFDAPVEYESEEQAVVNAEECFELPPVETLNCINIPIELAVESPRAEQSRRMQIFNQIGEMDFEESILHRSDISLNARKKRKSREHTPCEANRMHHGIVEIGQAVKVDSDNNQSGISAKNINDIKNLEPKTSKPITMNASYCDTGGGRGEGEGIQEEYRTPRRKSETTLLEEKLKFSEHLPELLSPKTLQRTIAWKAKSLAEELNLPVVSLQSISNEELEQSQLLAQQLSARRLHGAPTRLFDGDVNFEDELPAANNRQQELGATSPQLEDASVQTTPRKKFHEEENEEEKEKEKEKKDGMIEASLQLGEVCDFSNGQPIDDICRALCAASLIGDDCSAPPVQLTRSDCGQLDEPQSSALVGNNTLRFVPAQLIASAEGEAREISSFLLDFERIRDPLQPRTRRSTPPNSAESNTSSEWEFLDN